MGNLAPLPEAHRVELGDEPDFDLGEMSVCPAERIVVVGGERREVQPRVMQVLVALAKARPAVVSRDRLGEMCWDGRIVGDDALNRCVLALRHLVADIAPPPFAIETVSRVGYRLIERGAERDATSRLGSPKLWRQVALLAVLFIALAAAFYAWRQRSLAAQPASIAVLPFRNLGNGDPYFAEGIGEEILGQLAGEPQFRIVGGSSRGQTGESADVRDLGRRLDVDYVLEGTVRRQNQQVRVNAHLLRVSDGTRLWSHGYDGDLDDIFAIQRRIGVAIAGALQRKLSQAPVLAGPLVTDGQAYGLYLTARGLIRSRSRRAGPTAVDLLRDAIQIDQGYAPAWASLGEATLLAGALNDSESFVASASEAQGHVRHALRLAPDLPEAHRALGGLAGFGTPEAIAHLRRAAELEPNNAEYMIGLGIAYGATGEFEKELASYRKAAELDPFWFRAASSVATTVAEMGDRAKAEAVALESVPPNGVEQQLVLGKIAAISGDFSEAIRRWSIVIEADSPRWSNSARINRDGLAFALGLRAEPPMTPPRPLDQRHLWRVSMNDGPKPSVWQARNRNRLAAIVYRDENHVAAKLMLNAGRWRELVQAYDGPGGLVGIRRNVPLRIDQLGEAPVVALALRRAGRPSEADRLLRRAATLSETVYRRGRVPMWFDADVAAILAVQGRRKEAVARLSRAIDRGWRHGGSTDLSDFTDEPAFALLRGDRRFEQLRTFLRTHATREREESRRLGTQLAEQPGRSLPPK